MESLCPRLFLLGALMASGCQSPVPTIRNLEQAPPRRHAGSLKLPGESHLGPVIPGLAQGAVPQGLTRVVEAGHLLTSHYFDDGRPSCLAVIDWNTGMVTTDGYIILSLSYGRRNRSTIDVHRNPLAEPAHRIVPTSKGMDVPLWFLDGQTRIRSIDLPPLAENLVAIEGRLAVLFESGASKFGWFGKGPLDHILLLPLAELQP